MMLSVTCTDLDFVGATGGKAIEFGNMFGGI